MGARLTVEGTQSFVVQVLAVGPVAAPATLFQELLGLLRGAVAAGELEVKQQPQFEAGIAEGHLDARGTRLGQGLAESGVGFRRLHVEDAPDLVVGGVAVLGADRGAIPVLDGIPDQSDRFA